MICLMFTSPPPIRTYEQFAASMHTCLIINVLLADVLLLLLLQIRTLAIRREK